MLDFMNFINNINFLDVDYCQGLLPVIKLVRAVVTLIQWGVPFLLSVFGMIDLGKAVMAGKEDEMKKAQNTLLKRFIYAVAVFLVVTLVFFIMDLVADTDAKGTDTSTWKSCWNKVS